MKDYKLTKYELELMNVIWEKGEATVQEVCDTIPRKLAYTTVMTTLSMLAKKKKVLKITKNGRAFVYSPTVSREDVSTSVLENVREVLTGQSLSSLMLNLIEEDKISDDDIVALKSAIEKLEKKK